jgi:hypothetical protein
LYGLDIELPPEACWQRDALTVLIHDNSSNFTIKYPFEISRPVASFWPSGSSDRKTPFTFIMISSKFNPKVVAKASAAGEGDAHAQRGIAKLARWSRAQ